MCGRLVDRIFVQISGVCDQNLFLVLLHIIVRSYYYRSFYKSFGSPGVPSEKICHNCGKENGVFLTVCGKIAVKNGTENSRPVLPK